MKKLILLIIVAVGLATLSGCGPYEPYSSTPSASTLRSEHDILIQEAHKVASDFEDWQKREFLFLAELTEEQLRLYSSFRSSIQKNVNQANVIMNTRNLQNSLTEEKWNCVSELLIEGAKITQRAQDIVSREQNLLKQWQTGKEIAQYKQKQSQQAWQKFWQDFSDVQQRQLDRNAYGYQPVIITHPRNPNYYQERLAQQQLQQNFQQPKKQYNPYTGGYSNRKYNPYTGGYSK